MTNGWGAYAVWIYTGQRHDSSPGQDGAGCLEISSGHSEWRTV